MFEEKQQVEETTYLVSADGEYKQYVGSMVRDSPEWQKCKENIAEYEKSALGVFSQIVMSMKHIKFSPDDNVASILLPCSTNSCDDSMYIFEVETKEQFEALVKWMKLKHRSESVGVGLPVPKYLTHDEFHDGEVVEVQDKSISFYDKNDDAAIEPERFIGHKVVVYEACDYKMYLEGTIEEVLARHEVILKELEDNYIGKMKSMVK